MTVWAVPDRDILRRVIFQLRRPDWRFHSPLSGASPDGRWHAINGAADLAADSLAALLDQLEWFHAT